MDQHVTILGAIHIAWSAMGIVTALIIFTAVAGGGFLSGDIEVMAITTTIGSAVGLLLLIISLPGLIAGVGLIKRRSWARILALVVGFLNLTSVPFGTILGIYTIWVCLSEETKRLLVSG
ncbi:MAG: hypothetical protein JXB45_00905 [Candidatus Krumholzibacteriota bacterium]|nr:hypothetical protein [Candidatus Krumholzibacteriota bacterium]